MIGSKIKEENYNVQQYAPLVYKITKQFVSSVKMPWNDISSMAWEGLVLAFRSYDPDRSNMTFVQFAAYSIRNNILTSIDYELRTVRMSAYAQKKASDQGLPSFTSVSMTAISGTNGSEDSDMTSKEYRYKLYEEIKPGYAKIMDGMYKKLEGKFSERDIKIFYMTFSLKDYDEYKCKDIAKHFKVSEGRVSQIVKHIIEYIRQDKDLKESLMDLLN